MKEALERIRLAEESNNQAQQQLFHEIEQYQKEKQNQLQKQQEEHKQLRKDTLQALESSLILEEQTLEKQLQEEAHVIDSKNEEIYARQKENMVQKIIKEMRGDYGC